MGRKYSRCLRYFSRKLPQPLTKEKIVSKISRVMSALFRRPPQSRQPVRNWSRSPLLLEQLEERTVPTVLFQPILRGAEVFNFNGATMTQPVSNPYALNSPKVYFIF